MLILGALFCIGSIVMLYVSVHDIAKGNHRNTARINALAVTVSVVALGMGIVLLVTGGAFNL